MARVLYGTIVTELKGKLGGVVFQKCGAAKSVRMWSKGSQNNNAISKAARQKFSSLASTWRIITQTLRDQYQTYANTYPFYNDFGQPAFLNGYQAFIAINTYFQLCASGIVEPLGPYSPPTKINAYTSECNRNVSQCYFYTPSPTPTDNYRILYVSIPIRNQEFTTSRKYFVAGVIPDTQANNTNIYSLLNSAFNGRMITGITFWAFFRQVDLSNGSWVDNDAFQILISS